MSSIANYLIDTKNIVFGYDRSSNKLVDKLIDNGLKFTDKLDIGVVPQEFLDDNVAISTLAECDLVVFPYQKTKESASGAARMAIAAGVPIAVTPLEIFSDLEGAIELPGIASEDISRGLSHISDEDLERSRDYITKLSDMYQWRKVSGMYQELIGGDSNE